MYSANRAKGIASQINFVTLALVLCFAAFQLRPYAVSMVLELRLASLSCVSGIYNYYKVWWAASDEIRMLQSKNADLEREVGRLRSFYEVSHAVMKENDDLRAIVSSPSRKPPQYAAKPYVIHQHANSHYLLLPPTSSNVTAGQLVTEHDHTVGVVDKVLSNGVYVKLITDASTTLPVYIDNSTISGIIHGNNSNELLLSFIPDDAAVHVGDKLYVKQDVTQDEASSVVNTSYANAYKQLVGFISNIERSPDRGFLKITVQPAMRLDYDIWFTIG